VFVCERVYVYFYISTRVLGTWVSPVGFFWLVLRVVCVCVCMYVYVYVNVYVCVCVYIFVSVRVRVCVYVRMFMYIRHSGTRYLGAAT